MPEMKSLVNTAVPASKKLNYLPVMMRRINAKDFI
jgi:hypothetical protein